MIHKPSRAERTRLVKLADYLDSLPRGYKHFAMDIFFEPKEDDDSHKLEAKYAKENGGVGHCGTAACAVGHGPSAGILVPTNLVCKSAAFWGPTPYRFTVDWTTYSQMFTGHYARDDQGTSGIAFEWMFGGGWEKVDNHHWGAAARIRYVLAGKPIPDGFDSDDMEIGQRRVRALYRAWDKRSRT